MPEATVNTSASATGFTAIMPRPSLARKSLTGSDPRQTLNESPQPHSLLALGFLKINV